MPYDARPVTITDDAWPRIASAEWHSGAIECQANETAYVRVRQHEDGRTLVYGVRERGPGGMPAGYRGTSAGYLLAASHVPGDGPDAGRSRPTADEDVVRAIRRVAGAIGMERLGSECIGDLPAETL